MSVQNPACSAYWWAYATGQQCLSHSYVHRSPEFRDNPILFVPGRFLRKLSNPNRPHNLDDISKYSSRSFVFLPFGSGSHKFIDDQFYCMETVMRNPRVLWSFKFKLARNSENVGFFIAEPTQIGLLLSVHQLGLVTGAADLCIIAMSVTAEFAVIFANPVGINEYKYVHKCSIMSKM